MTLNEQEPIVDCYDAEYHLGLVPNDTAKAGENLSRLNDAMAAMWSGGSFPFERIKRGPILKPIRAAAKEFFFNGTILSAVRMGGALFGSGGRSYSVHADGYDNRDGQGGAVTRFTRINGQTGGAVFRLRGSGFKVEGIEFKGRPYKADSVGDGPGGAAAQPAGTVATPVGIEVEGRNYPASGNFIIRDCSINDCTYGICCKAGYYDDNGHFVENEDHADTSYAQGVTFNRVSSAFRTESQQAVCWNLNNILINGPGAILLDIVRGGNITVNSFWASCWNYLVLVQVQDYSPNCSYMTIRDFKWDHVPNPAGYLTIFKYNGVTGNVWDRRWTLRIEGMMDNYWKPGWWDTSKLIQVPKAAQNLPLDDILIDITGVPDAKFKRSGRWLIPTSDWQS